jgi:hypothetical protein
MIKNGLIIIIVALQWFSCTPTRESVYTLHKTVVNKTNKNLHYEVETDIDKKFVFVNALDSTSVIFSYTTTLEKDIAGLSVRLKKIQILKETVFNLTDTTKYIYSLPYEIIPQEGGNEKEVIYGQSLSWSLGENSTDENPVIYSKLNFTDEIVQIMQKDYNMLETLSAYYNN